MVSSETMSGRFLLVDRLDGVLLQLQPKKVLFTNNVDETFKAMKSGVTSAITFSSADDAKARFVDAGLRWKEGYILYPVVADVIERRIEISRSRVSKAHKTACISLQAMQKLGFNRIFGNLNELSGQIENGRTENTKSNGCGRIRRGSSTTSRDAVTMEWSIEKGAKAFKGSGNISVVYSASGGLVCGSFVADSRIFGCFKLHEFDPPEDAYVDIDAFRRWMDSVRIDGSSEVADAFCENWKPEDFRGSGSIVWFSRLWMNCTRQVSSSSGERFGRFSPCRFPA